MPQSPQTSALKLLVAVDFSEASRRSLAWALDHARRTPCEVHVIHVIEDHVSDLLSAPAMERLRVEMALIAREAEHELERLLPAERQQVGRPTRHVACGRPAKEILHAAEKLGAELIVMGTHGRGGVAGLFMGSVAQKVVRHAPCPVLIVRVP
jgi:nucleotide-binding universal stress UspA family protein